MALVRHNSSLEYAANTVEFWLVDENGEGIDIDTGTTFNIQRIDDGTAMTPVAATTITGNYIKFIVNPSVSLQKDTDSFYDYDNDKYEHIYSIKSATNVYVAGKLNLVKAA